MPRGRAGCLTDAFASCGSPRSSCHTGDLTSREFLVELEGLGPVAAVRGNMDEPRLRSTSCPSVSRSRRKGSALASSTTEAPERVARTVFEPGFPDCDAVAYGHSHQPEVSRVDETWILNPGSPTERRRAPEKTMIVLREGVPTLVSFGS